MNTLAGRGWRSQTWWIGKLIRFHTKRLRECRRGGATEYHRCPLPHTVGLNPTTLLNEVSRECAFSCARDRHGDDAVACLPRTGGPHPHGRLSGATPLPITCGLARP